MYSLHPFWDVLHCLYIVHDDVIIAQVGNASNLDHEHVKMKEVMIKVKISVMVKNLEVACSFYSLR